MHINPINKNQVNPNFNAKFRLVEQKGVKNLLPKGSKEILAQKVEKIGKSTDVLSIFLSRNISILFNSTISNPLKFSYIYYTFLFYFRKSECEKDSGSFSKDKRQVLWRRRSVRF